mgnify:CR=1 FL=1
MKRSAVVSVTRHKGVFGGQAIAYADENVVADPQLQITGPGDTTLSTDALTFHLNPPADPTKLYSIIDKMRAAPALQVGFARIPAVQAVRPGAASEVRYDSRYLELAFGGDNTRSQVYLTVSGQPLTFDEKSPIGHPGVFAPNLEVRGLSRVRGAIGGAAPAAREGAPSADEAANPGIDKQAEQAIEQFKDGKFDPASFLKDAAFLGGLNLVEILAKEAKLSSAPKIVTVTTFPDLPGGGKDYTKPTTTSTLDWSPTLSKNPIFEPLALSSLTLHARIVAAHGESPVVEMNGSVTDFLLKLFGPAPFLELTFNEFSFRSRTGSKAKVTPDIAKVTFGGPLSFINAFADHYTDADSSAHTRR